MEEEEVEVGEEDKEEEVPPSFIATRGKCKTKKVVVPEEVTLNDLPVSSLII